MTLRSALATLFTPDSPVALAANWFVDKADRQYLDDQIRSLQTLLTYSLRGQTSTWVLVHASSATVAVGDCLCTAAQAATEDNPLLANRYVTRALFTPLGFSGIVLGVALTAAPPGGWVRMATGGIIGPSITGLAAGGSGSVRVEPTTARCLRGDITTGYYPVGWVDNVGNLSLARGLIVP